MLFKRKAYDKLLAWKQQEAGRYSILIEGARRTGKSTLAEAFARQEYRSYILIDFSHVSSNILDCFSDISNLDLFFLRLQALTGKTLYVHESVILFDEIQLYPPARQAIKHLVKDGRYHYIETGSLISITKNVKDILIPSEEKKLKLYPMDYEEFLWATGKNSYRAIRELYRSGKEAGQGTHRSLMRDFRLYMAIGGMPQAVEAYIEGRNLAQIDEVKRSILHLYEDDFRKIDLSGQISAMYHSIPAQLSKGTKRYLISSAIGKRRSQRSEKLLFEMIDSRTVLACYHTTDPSLSPGSSKDLGSYKLYLADTGLFVTLLFIDRPAAENELYAKLLSDHLPANLGFRYETAVAQMIAATDRELFYHTWEKLGSTHYFEIDFLVTLKTKVTALEVKSSGIGKHASLDHFREKYARCVGDTIVLSQKDVHKDQQIRYLPIYMLPFYLEEPQDSPAQKEV